MNVLVKVIGATLVGMLSTAALAHGGGATEKRTRVLMGWYQRNVQLRQDGRQVGRKTW